MSSGTKTWIVPPKPPPWIRQTPRPCSRCSAAISATEAGWESTLALAEPYLQRLAYVSDAAVGGKDALAGEKVVSAVCAAGEIRIPLGDLVDLQKELARLEKERKNLEGEIARAKGKLNNPGFLSKAPAQLVEQEREKLKTTESMLEALHARIEDLKQA